MFYDIIIVGGGIAGLTCSAFLAKSGHSVLLLEKADKLGGCINSFQKGGFIFDGGIRAIENSGVLMPMLRQLGIEIEWVKNNISIGLEEDIFRVRDIKSLAEYESLLIKHFPRNTDEVKKIFAEIEKISAYIDVLYRIDNPLFLDVRKDRKYFLKVVMPWLVKYLLTIRKIEKLKEPVKEHLGHFTNNRSLIDVIAQHFFKDTPTFFALGYFQLYLNYYYPKGGTHTLPGKLEDYITDHGVEIRKNTKITEVKPELHHLSDPNGNNYGYKKLVWAADLKTLYNSINIDGIKDPKVKTDITSRKKELADKVGGDSIFTLYLCVDADKKYFSDISTEHFFYTPFSRGLLESVNINLSSKEEAVKCIEKFFKYNTYEISFPVLRDSNLAPTGKTGIIMSTLFDYSTTRDIFNAGWYDEFKILCENTIIDLFNSTIYPGIKDKIICQFSSTPLTLFDRHGNSEGAITGWGFNNSEMPAETRMLKIASSIQTPIPDIFQIGQWVFSPAGVPVSIITGKLGADKVHKTI